MKSPDCWDTATPERSRGSKNKVALSEEILGQETVTTQKH